jgi:hypothetical protein
MTRPLALLLALLLLVTTAPMAQASQHRIVNGRQWHRPSMGSAVYANDAF